MIPLFLSPFISSQRLSFYTSWGYGIQSGFFQHQIPPDLLWSLPSLVPLNVFSLVYAARRTPLFFLHRIRRAETFSCNNYGPESHDFFHLVLDCPVLDSLRLAIFGHFLTILKLWPCPWRSFPIVWTLQS